MARKNKPVTDDVDISFLFRPRNAVEKFSIWYDSVTGKITGIAPNASSDAGNFIVSESEVCIELLSGDVAIKEYLVGYDPEQEVKRLMHITEWGNLLGEKHELQFIDYATEHDISSQFALSFYKNQKKCELIVNHDAFINMFRKGNEDQIAHSQRQAIKFFIRDKYTGYLLARHSFEFDITNDELMEDQAEWLGECDLDDIEVISHKNFCTYSWTWQENQIERVVRVNRTRVIPASRSDDYAHLNFHMHDEHLICDSTINDPANYNIQSNIKIWITQREHPDALIGNIDIPIDMIASKKSFRIDTGYLKGLDFNNLDFLTSNQYIKIYMKDSEYANSN
jgi:hypothetical protein